MIPVEVITDPRLTWQDFVDYASFMPPGDAERFLDHVAVILDKHQRQQR